MSDDIKLNLNVPYSTSNNDAFTFSLDENAKPSLVGEEFMEEMAKEMREGLQEDLKKDPPRPLKYPFHKEDRYPCCIHFSILEQKGAVIEGVPNILGGLKEAYDNFVMGMDSVDSDTKEELKKQIETATKEESEDAEKVKGRAYSRGDIFKDINIYLTPGFATNDALTYSNVDLGMTGAAALNAFNGNEDGGFVGAISKMIQAGFGSISDTTGAGTDLAQLTISRNAQGIVGKLVPDELSNALKMSSAVTVNPNTRAMFKGVALRSFQFQFKFLPVSEVEAREVESIIKRFREHAFPETIALGDISAGYKYPHLFNIELRAHGKPIGTKIKTCVLESISTSYNSSSMAWHPGEEKTYASEYDLTLSFREEVALDAKAVRDGF